MAHWHKPVQERSTQNQFTMANKAWRPPPRGVTKLNTDASFDKIKKIAVAGIAGRNDKGEILIGLTKRFPAISPLTAEALATREACSLAINCNFGNVLIESDCLDLIKAYRKEINRGEIQSLLQDIWNMKSQNEGMGFTWTPREGNSVAHQIAQLAKSNRLPLDLVSNPPPSLKCLMDIECRNEVSQQEVMNGSGISNQRQELSVLPSTTAEAYVCTESFPFDPGI